MARATLQARSRGLARILQNENSISDLLQELTDQSPDPWEGIVGFRPTTCAREERLDARTRADLVLRGDDPDARAFVEVKLGHTLSDDQQRRYEALADDRTPLIMAALSGDRARLSDAAGTGWTFVPLGELFRRWADEPGVPTTAAALGALASDIMTGWDKTVIDALHDVDPTPFTEIPFTFVRRLVADHAARRLSEAGYPAHAGLNHTGTETILQAWHEIHGDPDRCFHAELRIPFQGTSASLRFGVDFWTGNTPETEAYRRECYGLASALREAISVPGLRESLTESRPDLASLLRSRGLGRKAAPHDAWEHVLRHGYGTPEAKSRRSVRPEFVGDGTLRHQAAVKVDVAGLSAADLEGLVDATLNHLRAAHAELPQAS